MESSNMDVAKAAVSDISWKTESLIFLSSKRTSKVKEMKVIILRSVISMPTKNSVNGEM
jgi:hypothetical protein